MLKTILKKISMLDIPIEPFAIEEEKLKELGECFIYRYESGNYLNRATLELIIVTKSIVRNLELVEKIYELFIKLEDRTDFEFSKIDIQNITTLKDSKTKTIHTMLHLDFVGKL